MRSLSLLRLITAALLLASSTGRADIVINEIVSAASQRALQWDGDGTPKVGTGTPWPATTFNDSTWRTGPQPFGYGTITSGPAYGTNTATQMQYLTPTLYLRKSFTVSPADAARPDQVQLTVNYNDGFICYINGVELVRRWAGPVKQFHYHDQPAYNPNLNAGATSGFYTETINLGAANGLLTQGTNVIAIQALNIGATNTTFLMRATLTIAGSPTLVGPSDTWKYLPGVVEPSGNLYDPTLIFSGKLNVPWAQATGYDDTAWSSGPGPIGAGTVTGTVGTNVPGVIGQTPSLYLRTVFSATAAQAADTAAMQLLVDYDDSFVAYINGVEVARANIGALPNTFPPATAVANGTRNNGSQTTYSIDPPSRLLKEGLNVLAIQVHNVTISDPDLYVKADLKTGGGTVLAANNRTWKYLVGTAEPVATDDNGTEDSPEGPDYANDWIELYNNGASDVSLTGWRLSDSPGDSNKWFFPAGVTIPAGGYLVVFCDGEDKDLRSAGGYIHTSFKLGAGGEYLALYNANAALVQDFSPALPRGSAFHSYGRKPDGSYVFFDTTTPGAANTGNEFSGYVADPTFSLAGGFYATAQSITLSCATSGATIRYTKDGSEPTETTGAVYVGAIPAPVSAGTVIRARAFKTGLLPSATITNTYLINQTAARRSLPAMVLTADPGRSLYRPYGVFAITNNDATNNYTSSLWYAGATPDPLQYNNPNLRGFFSERPGNLQFMQKVGGGDPSGAAGFNINIGIRCAGSPYSRPRYRFDWLNNADPNSGGSGSSAASPFANDSLQKPQINTFFRDDYGGNPLQYPLFPGAAVTTFDNLRLRSGKNDISNPFVRDELTRRLFIDMGQVGVHGIMSTLWINGVYKGYYNPVERPRESFFQRWYNSSKSWDVWVINDAASGDNLMLQELVTYLRNNPQNVYANYQGAMTRLEMANFIDYLILNLYECMGDWPHNNYLMARERSSTGKWVFTVWDGEGSFGSFAGNVRTNQFATATANTSVQNLIVSSNPAGEGLLYAIRTLYTTLRASPEFKMLFADRLQKHFFNNGALTDANILTRKNALKTELSQLFSMSDGAMNDWVNGKGNITRFDNSANVPSRRQVLLGGNGVGGYYDDTAGGALVQAHLVGEGLWPLTQAPTFSQFGGTVASGFQLTITNPNGAGTLYYTVDGSDPRAVGGAAQGTVYVGPVAINQTTVVRARVLNANSEWSPLTEATFTVTQKPAVLITEIMYNPLGQGAVSGDEFEFVELKNTSATTVNLNGWQLADGVTFAFPAGASIAPGGFVVVAKNPTRFASRYPGVSCVGPYSGQLDNGGELLTLRDLAGAIVTSVTYGDSAPWPKLADGYGNSLVPVNPNSNPAPSSAANWRASAAVNGSPAADDPTPSTQTIYVNELLTNAVVPQTDTVELYNPTAQPVDLGGWYLSNSKDTPKKYRIPDGTIIAAGGYVTFTESDFNPGGAGFSFSLNGDEVRLSAADAAGNLTGYSHGFSFNGSAPGVSFGRYVNSVGTESFPAQKAQTFGAENAGPIIGPVVISELMYFPAAGGDEFVELRNISNAPVQLFDPATNNGWRISGIGYTLPGGVTLQPRQVILVTPLTESAWRTKYGTPSAVAIFGPYAGSLDNSGERITLQQPGTPYLNASAQTVIPYIDVDSVKYQPSAPWPASPAGTGPSLERQNWRAYADEPSSWRASPTNGGSPGVPAHANFTGWQSLYFTGAQAADPNVGGINADPDGDGISNLREFAHGIDPLAPDAASPVSTGFAMDNGTGPFLTLQFRRSLSADNVTFAVDTASALGNWSLGSALQLGPPVNNGDGTETLTFRDTVPSAGVGAAPQRFIRLRVIGN